MSDTSPSTPSTPVSTVIVGGARTPMGRLLGQLAGLSAADLGAVAIRGALARAGITGTDVDAVVLGQVLQAGAGQLPARQAALAAGITPSTPVTSVNKVCLSGLAAIAQADQLIRAGEAEVVVAGGMESMTSAPHLAHLRTGLKYGPGELVDSMAFDGLHDAATDQPMGALTEQGNDDGGFSREEQDAFAARSHRRAAAAADLLAEEIVEVRIPQRKGDDVVITTDEGVRADATAESMGRLRPAFRSDGTITAGSASPISDGAAAVVVMSRAAAERLGCSVWASIIGYGQVAGPDSSLQTQPSRAILAATERAGVTVADLDLIEINEAFAAVGLASVRDLGLSADEVEATVNVHGGALALGHPLGASGARLVLHLAAELHRRGSGLAAAALCGGGGQGDALVLRA